ncbi:MAG: hypothetical protein ACI9XJ_001812 [Marivirga sp.]|jgi:hypothetical protein
MTINHLLLILSFLCLTPEELKKELAMEPLRKRIVLDNENSSVKIIGTTNVNEFSCVYKSEIFADTLEIKLSPEGEMIATSGASFQLPVDRFKCESSQMTVDFKALLKSEGHPNINVKLLGIYDSELKNQVKLAIVLAGIEKNFDVFTTIAVQENVFHCQGKPKLCITDFGLSAPEKFFGMIKVNETITVEVNLTFSVIST